MANSELQGVGGFIDDWDLYEQWFIFYLHMGHEPAVADELAFIKASNNEAIPEKILA